MLWRSELIILDAGMTYLDPH